MAPDTLSLTLVLRRGVAVTAVFFVRVPPNRLLRAGRAVVVDARGVVLPRNRCIKVGLVRPTLGAAAVPTGPG